MSQQYTRRTFLKFAAAGAAGALVAACQPVAMQPAGAPAAQPAGAQEKVVRILLDSWAMAEMPFDQYAREFAETHPGVKIVLQSTFEGYDTKVLAQINDGTLEWSAAGISSSASSSLPRRILSGMLQPMDDYFAGSKEPGADQVLKDMIPTIRKASEHEGKFWGFPYSYENISLNWHVDFLSEVGATEAPATWDELLTVGRELKKWGAEKKIVPFSFIPDLDASTGVLIYSALENPFNEEMLLKWDAPEAIAALNFYKQLVTEELTPPHGFDGYNDMWLGGGLASLQAQSSRGVWGQRAFGTEKVATAQVPTYKKGSGAGTPFWGNCTSLLAKAPNPQEAIDYLVFAMGPQNANFQKACIQSGKTPVFQSSYDNIIAKDPMFSAFKWMISMRDQVDRSMARPFNNYFSIQETFYAKYIVLFTDPGSTMTAEEVAKSIMDEARAEIAKQKA